MKENQLKKNNQRKLQDTVAKVFTALSDVQEKSSVENALDVASQVNNTSAIVMQEVHDNMSNPENQSIANAKLAQEKSNTAAMMLINGENPQKQYLSKALQTPWYESYQTTLLLILILHLIFVRQWKKHRTWKDSMVSYDMLVQKKHWHRAVVALLSHPPADTVITNRGGSVTVAIHSGSNDYRASTSDTRSSGRMFIFLGVFQRYWNRVGPQILSFLQPLTHGHLSGFPLLAYNSHLLWSCRVLEPVCMSSWHYARILLGLAVVAILIELRISHTLIDATRSGLYGVRMGGFGSIHQFLPVGRSSQIRRMVSHRSTGTPTMLLAALLVVYRRQFLLVHLQVVPFLNILPHNIADPTLTYYLCIFMLGALSWRNHPIPPIFCGTLSGLLWTTGITSFLGNPYWGTCLLLLIVILCALSMRSSSGHSAILVPCIDYVAWNRRGQLFILNNEEVGRDDDGDNDSEEDISDDETGAVGQGDIDLLLDRRTSTGNEDRTFGRMPLINGMDSEDIMGDIEMPSGLYSRRAGSSRMNLREMPFQGEPERDR